MTPLSRRGLLTGFTAALGTTLLPGCSSGTSATAPSASASASSSATATRGVKTATGTVQVPEKPTRVVVLDTAELDSAITLGNRPVGAARAAENSTFPDYWPSSWLKTISYVGPIGSPDLDAVARLKPDLILSNQSRDGSRYDELSAIAPTVLTASTGYTWKDDFRTHAQALNAQATADSVADAYGLHVAQVAQALGGRSAASQRQISLVRFMQGGHPRLYATQNFLGTILADLDLGRPDSQSGDVFDVQVTSTAQLADADGSTVFYATYGDPAKAGTDAALSSSAWLALDAVKARRAFEVDDELWYQGIGYTGANMILNQLRTYLTG